MIVAERVSPTGVVVGQTLIRPQTAGGAAQQSRSSSVGSTTNQGMIVTPSFNPTGVRLPDAFLSKQIKSNPIADRANWRTGGRRTAPAAGGFNPQWLLLGGAVLLLLAMGRKKKR